MNSTHRKSDVEESGEDLPVLPPELWGIILNFLSNQDLNIAKQVSWAFYSMVLALRKQRIKPQQITLWEGYLKVPTFTFEQALTSYAAHFFSGESSRIEDAFEDEKEEDREDRRDRRKMFAELRGKISKDIKNLGAKVDRILKSSNGMAMDHDEKFFKEDNLDFKKFLNVSRGKLLGDKNLVDISAVLLNQSAYACLVDAYQFDTWLSYIQKLHQLRFDGSAEEEDIEKSLFEAKFEDSLKAITKKAQIRKCDREFNFFEALDQLEKLLALFFLLNVTRSSSVSIAKHLEILTRYCISGKTLVLLHLYHYGKLFEELIMLHNQLLDTPEDEEKRKALEIVCDKIDVDVLLELNQLDILETILLSRYFMGDSERDSKVSDAKLIKIMAAIFSGGQLLKKIFAPDAACMRRFHADLLVEVLKMTAIEEKYYKAIDILTHPILMPRLRDEHILAICTKIEFPKDDKFYLPMSDLVFLQKLHSALLIALADFNLSYCEQIVMNSEATKKLSADDVVAIETIAIQKHGKNQLYFFLKHAHIQALLDRQHLEQLYHLDTNNFCRWIKDYPRLLALCQDEEKLDNEEIIEKTRERGKKVKVKVIKKTQAAAKPKKIKTEEIKKKAADSPDEDLFTIYLMYFCLGLLFLLFLPITLPITICVIFIMYGYKNSGDNKQASFSKPKQKESWLWKKWKGEEKKSLGRQQVSSSADIENSLPSSDTANSSKLKQENLLVRWGLWGSQSQSDKERVNGALSSLAPKGGESLVI